MSLTYNLNLNKGDNQQSTSLIGMQDIELKSSTGNQDSKVTNKKSSQLAKRKRSFSLLTTAATTTTTTSITPSTATNIFTPISTISNEAIVVPSKHSKIDINNCMSLLNSINILMSVKS